ncbi:MAG: hypothetical protein ABEH56_00855 [Salinirussus sp.]
MRRSSDRAATEPLVALVAVVTVCAGLGLYAGVLGGEIPAPGKPDVAGTTLDRVHSSLATVGVVHLPASHGAAATAAPDGWKLNVTIRTGEITRQFGPAPPPGARTARRRIAVERRPSRIRPATLAVAVWR